MTGELESTGAWIGRAERRREDARLVTGAGRFVDDIAPADCLHLDFVRSPMADARILSVDVAAATCAPGVVAVFTGASLVDLPAPAVNALLPDIREPAFELLGATRAAAVGQPLAAVIATSRDAARDAADLIEIRLEADAAPTPPTGPEIAHSWTCGDIEAAFARADEVVSLEVTHARVAPSAMEPRAALAVPETESDRLTVWLSTQTPHRARQDLARVLGLALADIRVITPDVGGAFGGKASIYPEELVVAFAARRLGRAVKWRGSRAEDLAAATHGRGARNKASLALDRDGRLLGLRARLHYPLGHWLPYSAAAPARNAARILPGPYELAALDTRVDARTTPTAAMGIYRGAGRPEAAMLMERLMDRAARRLGLDPVEIRRRNLLPAHASPITIASGARVDSGDYAALLEAACLHADYAGLRRAQGDARSRGEIRGIGVALYIEPCGEGFETATVSLDPCGRIRAATGSSAQGQGRETAFAQIVAQALGVAPGLVDVLHGDTATTPAGIGALASRSTAIGGSAMWQAANAFRDAVLNAAAQLLQSAPDRLVLTPEGLAQADGAAWLGWAALAPALTEAGEPLPEAFVSFRSDGEAWSSGCCIAAVSIDADTGVLSIDRLTWVDDAGVVVNPLLVEGQLHGGMAQGLGEALMEEIVYDETGQLITGSLMDYALPRASDVPPVSIHKRVTPSPANPLGAKGVGEAGCIGVPAAIVNAVHDALAPFGEQISLDMPLTAPKIWRAMRGAKGFPGGHSP